MADYNLSDLSGDYFAGTAENDTFTVQTDDPNNYTVRGAGGDDTATFGDGYDTAVFAGSLYQKNDTTGELELMYEITQVDETTIEVRDLFASVEGNDGTDTLINVDRLRFEGDNTTIRVSAETWAWNFVRYEWDQASQTEIQRDVRMIRIEGGVFSDLIYGEQGADSLEGRGGNDVIYADGLNASEVPVSRLNFAGGDHWGQQVVDSNNVVETDLLFDAVSAGLPLVDVGVIGSGGGYTRSVSPDEVTGAKVWLSLRDNPDSDPIDLANYSSTNLSELFDLQSTAKLRGADLQLWVESASGEKVLLALESDSNLYSDDEIRGGGGNDFIDGGLTRVAPEGGLSWRGNEARYDGLRSDYEVDQFTVAAGGLDDTAVLSSGLTIAEFFELIGRAERPASLDQALAIWEVDPALFDTGLTYTLVADTVSNRDGVDILLNINTLSFSDQGVNLTLKVEPKYWSDLDGNNYQGSIVNDVLEGGDGFDNISGREGNDLILAGSGGDWVEGNSGNDYADGGANGSSDNSWENRDRFRLSGDLKRYDIQEVTLDEVTAFLSSNFDPTNSVVTGVSYDESKKYYLITDKSPFGKTDANPYGGDGQDLITGFERIEFADTGLELVAEINWYAQDWSNTAELGVRGTIFADTIDASVEMEARVAEFDVAVINEQLTVGYNKSTWGELGAGDDVYFGASSGDRIALGSGDDIYVGGGSEFIQHHEWIGRDEVRFNGDLERFELIELLSGNKYTFKDGDADVVIDLTDLAAGDFVFKGQSYSLGYTPDTVIVVKDRLPVSLGGEGVDLVIDASALSFDDQWLPLDSQVNFHTQMINNPDLADAESRVQVMRAHVNAGFFGGLLDFTEGLTAENPEGVSVPVVRGHINTSDGNDDILGFKEENFVSIRGGGNDFFNAVSNFNEAGGSGVDAGSPWEYYDRVEFSGSIDQYKISEVYVSVGGTSLAKRDANTDEILESSIQSTDFDTKSIKVESLRDPSDVVYLVGVEEIGFSGGEDWLRFGVTYDQWSDNIEIEDRLAANLELGTRSLTDGSGVSAWKGSPFNDVLVGREAPDYYSLGDKSLDSPYFEVELPQSWTALFLDRLRDGFLLAYDDTNSDGYLEIVDSSTELVKAGSTIQFFLYMDSVERQLALQNSIDSLVETPASAEEAAALMYDAFTQNAGNWATDWEFLDSAPMVGKVAGSTVLLPATLNFTPADTEQGLSASVEFFSRLDNGSDVLRGNAGDDTLFGLGGGDRFQGGTGDDIYYGGGDAIGNVMPVYQAPWAMANNDIAEYEGVSARYSLAKVFVQMDAGEVVRDSTGKVITSSVAQAGYEEVWTVTDSVADADGGTGTDYLFDIERVRFFGDNKTIWLEDAARFTIEDWYPNGNWAMPSGTTFLAVGIYDRALGGSTVDLNSLWSQAPEGYARTFTGVSGNVFTIDGFASVRASDGFDVVKGLVSETSSLATQYWFKTGHSTDYNFSQEVDAQGESYVQVKLKDGVDRVGLLQEAKLYDIDYIWWEQERLTMLVDAAEKDHFGLFLGTGSHLDATVFDDVFDAATVKASVDPDQANFATVWLDAGDDRTYAEGSHTLYQEGRGNDFFDGGSGVDIVDLYNTALEQLTIEYFIDNNGDERFDANDTVISLAEFQENGLIGYYGMGTDVANPLTASAVTQQEFLNQYSAENLVTFAEGDTLMTEGLGGSGAGWVTFADGYYISVRDSSGESGSGSDVYKDIEAIHYQDTFIDIVTGAAYSGLLVPYPWESLQEPQGTLISDDFTTLLGPQIEEEAVFTPFSFDVDYGNSEILDLFMAGYNYGGDNNAIACEYVDLSGDSVYYGNSGVVTVSGDLETALVAELRAAGDDKATVLADLLESSDDPVPVDFVERFIDGRGDDIYVGNGIFDLLPTTNNYRYGEMLGVDGPISRYEITAGVLDVNGSISGAHSTNQTLLDFADVNLAGQNYLIVRDTQSDQNGGNGENLAIGIDYIGSLADQAGYWFGTQTRLDGVRLQLTQYAGLWDVNVQTNDKWLSDYANDTFKSVEIRAWEGDSLYVGFEDHVFNRDWDYLDKVRLDTLSIDNFEISSVWVAQNDDSSFVKGSNGKPVEYGSEALAKLAGEAKLAYKLDGSGSGVGIKYVVDIEKVIFNGDIEVDLETVFRFRDLTGISPDVHVTYDDATNWVPISSFSEVEINLSDVDGYWNPTLADWLTLEDQAVVEVGSDLYIIDRIRDGAGDDVVVVNTYDYGARVRLSSGDDFVHFLDPQSDNFLRPTTVNNAVGWTKEGTLRIEITEHSSRFEVSQIYIKLQADDDPVRRSDGSIREYSADDAGVVLATKIQDVALKDFEPGYLGTKIVVGAEEINFSDTSYNMGTHTWQEDWDNDGQIDRYGLRGSEIGEVLLGDWGAADSRDRIEGRGGDDVLIGGANGDELRGGSGDDLLIGGANGTTGHFWDDQDRADYWPLSLDDLLVSQVRVAFNLITNEIVRSSSGDIITAADEYDLRSGFELVDAVEVVDLTGALGTDILIGIELINTSNGQIRTNISYEYQDWDNDGSIDQVEMRGTDFSDTVGGAKAKADVTEALSKQNGIDTGDGDDDIYAGAGGDWIRPGSGVDFVDGGRNGNPNEWGWTPTDNVQFSGEYDRYVLTNYTFAGQALDVTDQSGKLLFSVDAAGKLVRASAPETLLSTLNFGQVFTTVEDKLPNFDYLSGDGFNLLVNVESLGFSDRWLSLAVERNVTYDGDGNALYGWMNGTLAADTIRGSSADDWIGGSDGDDVLIGLKGNDNFSGGAGDDLIYGDAKGEIYGGRDNVRYDGDFEQFSIVKRVAVVDGFDSAQTIVEVTDKLPAELGGAGKDTLVGIESLSFNDKWVRIGVESWDQFDANGELISTHFQGSDFDDVVKGSLNGDQISDQGGNDTLYGFDGADQFHIGFGDDTVYGGAEGLTPWGQEGVDEAHFSGSISQYDIAYYDAASKLTASYDSDGFVIVRDTRAEGGYGTNTLYGVERLSFDDQQINLVGLNSGTYIVGTDGNDIELKGTWGSSVDYRIEGNGGDDALVGQNGDDLLEGGDGNDTITGSGGNDVAVYAGKYADFAVTGDDTSATVVASGDSATLGTDTLTGVEQLRFEDATVNLKTGYFVRDLDKNGSFETAIFTGIYSGSNETDAGFKSVIKSLVPSLNTAEFDGLTLDYRVTLSDADDTFALGNGDNRVVWSAGADSLTGGTGTDTLVVADTYYDEAGAAKNWVVTSSSVSDGKSTTSFSGFELVEFSDQTFSLVDLVEIRDSNGDGIQDSGRMIAAFTGSTSFNVTDPAYNTVNSWVLNGGNEVDVLTAGDGDDVLVGSRGDDTLDGGIGYDIARYVGSFEDFDVNPGSVTGEWSISGDITGSDTLVGIEAIQFNDELVRLEVLSDLKEVFVFGEGRVEQLTVRGTRYNDDLEVTSTGSSAQNVDVTVTGGAGDDVFIVDSELLKSTRILDFEGLDTTETVQDRLKIGGTGTTMSVAELLESADTTSNPGAVTVNIGDGEIVLEGIELADLSEANIILLDLV